MVSIIFLLCDTLDNLFIIFIRLSSKQNVYDFSFCFSMMYFLNLFLVVLALKKQVLKMFSHIHVLILCVLVHVICILLLKLWSTLIIIFIIITFYGFFVIVVITSISFLSIVIFSLVLMVSIMLLFLLELINYLFFVFN